MRAFPTRACTKFPGWPSTLCVGSLALHPMLTGRTEIRVRYAETDMMSIAYHGSYLPWLEIGRTELLRANGFPYAELERLGYRLPVLEVNVSYKQIGRAH